MRIVFSRKGFDSASGGGPSPIVEGCPVSLPIPGRELVGAATYGELGLGELAARASKGRLSSADRCHQDPMFLPDGRCLFGQCGGAQTHLANRGVGVGDLFVFFGLFREDGQAPHHRLFGYLWIEEMVPLAACSPDRRAQFAALGHPHALAMHGANDVIYVGPGKTACTAHPDLRLTVAEGPPSLWNIPAWLQAAGLSYHHREDRWLAGNRLRSVSRGQEFVADIGDRKAPRAWAARIIAAIRQQA